ncbi:hypothetical protein P43SY_006871 [Pythium insidiosum]|uniref:Alcohol dehydrogenase n=1 Tax=Pythium insidiosum TaxID=114742 RepID=A0AAD5LRS2_PYTIN|nr:hypothetical protein P43SY_006871 [Pythium insidiosum]
MSPSTERKIAFGGPSVLQLVQLADPELLDASDVIVQVHAAGVNPIDFKRRQGALKMVMSTRCLRSLNHFL